MTATRYWHRLPQDVRETILNQLREKKGELPISTAQILQALKDKKLAGSIPENELKNSIAEAAIQNGFNVAFEK